MVVNLFPHSGHWKGFSPVWIFWCLLRFEIYCRFNKRKGVAYLSKGLVAVRMRTLVRFLSGVNSKVFLQGTILGERLSTTFEGTKKISTLF